MAAGPTGRQGLSVRCGWCFRDGGVEAVIDHEGGFMASREVTDVYATEEPQAAFHARVAFCLDIHNEVRAGLILGMRSSVQDVGTSCDRSNRFCFVRDGATD